MSVFTEANRIAFKYASANFTSYLKTTDRLPSDFSDSYNKEPWMQRITQRLTDALRQQRDFLGARWLTPEDDEPTREVKLLDYACGHGAVSLALGPYVSAIRAVDLSDGMVARYNAALAQAGLPHEKAYAVVGDLGGPHPDAGQLGGPDFHAFDVAAVSLALHHVEDPALMVRRLAARLRPATGVLVVLDFLPFEHSHSRHRTHSDLGHTIKQHGFTREEVASLFRQAGLEEFGFEVLPEPVVLGSQQDGKNERTVFIARGRRP